MAALFEVVAVAVAVAVAAGRGWGAKAGAWICLGALGE